MQLKGEFWSVRVIYDACVEVGKGPKFSDKWLSDEAWFCGMLHLFCHFKTLGVNRGAMNMHNNQPKCLST